MLAEHLARVNPTMPHDHDEKPPAPEAPPAFDFNKLPRWRSKLFPTADDPPEKPVPQKPAPAQAGETAPEFDPDILPRVRPQFRVTTDDLGAKRALQKPAPTPSPRKTTGGGLASANARPTREPAATPGR